MPFTFLTPPPFCRLPVACPLAPALRRGHREHGARLRLVHALAPARFETHSADALLTFCLPVGLAAYWMFQCWSLSR